MASSLKKLIILSIILLSQLCCYAQVGEKISNVTLEDTKGNNVELPFIGEKVAIVYYIDPDVEEVNVPLSDALEENGPNMGNFGVIAIINCKDTWYPNAAIKTAVKREKKKHPEANIYLDRNKTLKNAWDIGDCNNAMIIYILGKDAKVLYAKTVKTEEESKAIVDKVINTVKENTGRS